MPETTKKDLEAMDLDELRAKFTEVTGEETKDRSKKRIIEKIENELRSIEAAEEAKTGDAEAEAEKPAPTKGKKKVAADDAETPDDDGHKTSALSVEELRAKYVEIVGRETKSTNW